MAENAKRKPDIADFFKPRSAVPQKRPSPSEAPSQDQSLKRAKSPTPGKPTTPARPRNGDIRNYKSPSIPGSGSVVSIPFRSPRPPAQLAHPTYPSASLFKQISSLPVSSSSTSARESSTSPPTPGVERTQRSIIQDGELVEVRGSDEDSDTDSLPSLSDLLEPKSSAVKRRKQTAKSSEDDAEVRRREMLEKFTQMRSKSQIKGSKVRRTPQNTSQSINMNQLLDEHFGDQEVDTLFADARGEAEVDNQSRPGALDDGNDCDVLKSLIGADSDGENKTSRLLSAVERTEVFHTDKKYTFFQDGGQASADDRGLYADEYFEADPTGRWSHRESRSQDILAGHVAHLARNSSLPDSLLKWMFYNVVIEKEHQLRNAYVEALSQASPLWTRTNVSVDDLTMLFEILGARTVALDEGPINETQRPSNTQRRRRKPVYLISALALFCALASDMDFVALGRLSSLIARIAVDVDIMGDNVTALGVEETLATLINHPSQEARFFIAEKLLSDLPVQLRDASLQADLLSHIQPTTPFAARLRVCLAHQFLFGESSVTRWDKPRSGISLKQITKHVHSVAFTKLAPNAGQDLASVTLKATTRLLDVAIADGDRPHHSSTRKDQVNFNRLVDNLADAVGDACASITDTGASHMRRTEAKEALRALHFRLLYSVRTEPRPVKNIFGQDGDDYRAGERSKDFMSKFFKKQRQVNLVTAKVSKAMLPTNEALINQPPAPLSSKSKSGTERSESEVLIRRQLGSSQ